MIKLDIVTVHHNDTNRRQAAELHDAILEVEPTGWRFVSVDNSTINRGFAKGCNWGALHPRVTAPYIGFLNPDVKIEGPFIDQALRAFANSDKIVITGCRWGKPDHELAIWGVSDWVCGAAMFVRRSWFVQVGGFDERYVWSWEETDLIRQAETAGLVVRSCDLAISHDSPTENSEADTRYKQFQFEQSRRAYARKWGIPMPSRSRRSGRAV